MPSKEHTTGDSVVFLSPHNDDETLFGAFTLLRERPRVVTVLRSYVQEQRGTGITYQQREAENEAAVAALGVSDWEQWPFPDSDPPWDRIEERLATIQARHVFAPAVEVGGHAHHNVIGELAAKVWPGKVTGYTTYTEQGRTHEGRLVPWEHEWVLRKLEALLCYRSQIVVPETWTTEHFLTPQFEYYAEGSPAVHAGHAPRAPLVGRARTQARRRARALVVSSRRLVPRSAPGSRPLPARHVDSMSIREYQRQAIRAFLERRRMHLRGSVLDYGAGQQPYRELVEAAGAAYHPYDRVDFPASVADRDLGDAPLSGNWDTILCTQMLQYVPDVPGLLGSFRQSLQRGGHLLLTYATNWDVIDDADLHRHTPGGMAALLEAAGFTVLVHEKLGSVRLQDFSFPLGYGVVAAV